ncbi:undecaprenyl-diphosphate phosphatase [Hydromonas duriensis]|uniref:Undecaprenyl-diphosphatase n=1 Tax=Hydromonas duriensis TaxID=1527608 RepID=A0A4R6Y5W2_9BURK|nr:undecaprenyl-diphosphate phosphatase [Hydromonas duriensis]TDR30902.1 undecaprenyl-diphosphatase [Hydromonas duriensis]
MDFTLAIKAALLGIVEGLTEFLPISSTGHLILTQSLLGLHGEFWDAFEVAIQFGAIIAVIWEFRERIVDVVGGMFKGESLAWRFAINVVIATIPAIVLALLFGKTIKAHLFNPIAVATALVVGGLVILWAERRQVNHQPRIQSLDDLTAVDALKVGLAQTAAVLFPGTSRSGATIIGGMFFGISRQVATHFSFFLAIPILFGASAKELLDIRHLLNQQTLALFGIGFIFSFISAFVCVRWLLRFVSNHNFVGFAWYRIIFGGLILISWAAGWLAWS